MKKNMTKNEDVDELSPYSRKTQDIIEKHKAKKLLERQVGKLIRQHTMHRATSYSQLTGDTRDDEDSSDVSPL